MKKNHKTSGNAVSEAAYRAVVQAAKAREASAHSRSRWCTGRMNRQQCIKVSGTLGPQRSFTSAGEASGDVPIFDGPGIGLRNDALRDLCDAGPD